MKTITLIPTDFSLTSLQLARHALTSADGRAVELVLMHCMHMPDSITELLFFSKRELIDSFQTDAFRRECKTLKTEYNPQLVAIKMELFTGWNQNAFNNFVAGNRLDRAVIPRPYVLDHKQKGSFSPVPFIRKSGLKIIEVEIEKSIRNTENDGMAEYRYAPIYRRAF